MGNLNKIMLIGHVCQDPEKRTIASGSSVVNVNLATTEKWKDKQGQMQEQTEFHRLVVWQGADVFAQYVKKGSQIYVEGSNQTREWLDKDGNKRYTTEIKVRGFQFLDKPNNSGQQQQQSPQQNQQSWHPAGNAQPRPQFQQPQQQNMASQQQQPDYNYQNDNVPF